MGTTNLATPPQKPLKRKPTPLPRSFFDRPTLRVAKDLLGKYLMRETAKGLLETRIVDVEAYVGPEDRACHASKGRTKRTDVLFGQSGVTYVYLIYGMYHCLNFVTERIDFPAAVLIRGIDIVTDGTGLQKTDSRIDGPGRVCRFLEIDRTLNRIDSTQGHMIWVEDRGERILPTQIHALPRINVDYAGEWAKKPWRFCIPDPKKAAKKRTAKSKK